MTTIACDLDVDVFRELGALANLGPGPMSPWPTRPESTAALQAWLAASKVDIETLRSTANRITDAHAAASVRYQNAPTIIEFATFISVDREPVGLTTIDGGRLRLEDPAPIGLIVDALSAYLGRSPLRSLPFHIELPQPDALVWAVLIDDRRRRYLHQRADGTFPAPGLHTPASIRATLDADSHDPLSLLGVLAAQPSTSLDPTSTIDDSLGRLASLGLVDLAGTLQLTSRSSALAERFAFINNCIDFERLRLDATGAPERSSFVCLQAGVTDLLCIETVGRQVELSTISPDALLGFLEHRLRRPDHS